MRSGLSQRAAARRFHVALPTVQRWLQRAGDAPLDRVDWQARRPGVAVSPRRTAAAVEGTVLAVRQDLREHSALGEYGAAAVRRELLTAPRAPDEPPVPAERTIARIFARHGVVDRARRVRRLAPPPGWHLPAVVRGEADVDAFDVVEDLKLAGGPRLDVITGVAVRSGLASATPVAHATASAILAALETHWRVHGRPRYAQFDNDTRFQGPHQYRDTFGRVVRWCLQLAITPVFAPPYEFGFQNAVEHFNGLFTSKVWHRFHHASLGDFAAQSQRFLAARHTRLARRLADGPARTPWPSDWQFAPQHLRAGVVIFVRRTSATGTLTLLGQTWPVDGAWCDRLVRAEVDLGANSIRCYALRRREPTAQPQLAELPYTYPRPDLLR